MLPLHPASQEALQKQFIDNIEKISTSKSTENNESVDFLRELKVPGIELREMKYTKKSLILAQDER